ncbi:MAG TPA: MarR family transcriptional regulator [Candidatus Saccharimonadales bacterium]|nr:MarR family transcriptional regulator [Candidatus Saccharimonadales bacterium]
MTEKEQLLQEILAKMTTGHRLMIACMQRFKRSTTASQTEALAIVYHEGPITLKKLASQMQLTPGSITQLVEQLERLEFVTRTPSTSDRRVTHVSVTEQGAAEISRIKAQKEDLFKNVYKDLSLDEARTMVKVQEKMIAYLKKQADEQPKE